MYSVMTMTLIIMLIDTVVMLLASILSKKFIVDREKNSPMECGFDPKSSSWLSFSLNLF